MHIKLKIIVHSHYWKYQAKSMKKMINNHLVNYLESNNLMNINQYGFRKGTGTDTAIATIYKTIAVSPPKKNIVL